MRKKLLSILLVLSLMLALVPAAFAADIASGTCGAVGDGSNVIWTLDETGLLTISGTGKIASGTGGSIWSDKPVLAVDIRSGVTGVGKDAFYGCDDLQVISLPDTVTQLDDNAFGNCPALSDILVDAKNPAYKSVDGALYSKDGTVLVKGPANAETFVVPDGVATIGDYAFFGAKCLTSIYFPEGSMTTIGAMAFEFCEGLTELLLPAGVTEIGMYAFAHCSGLRSVDLPVSLKHVSDMAFLSAGTMDAGIADINYAGSEQQWNAIAFDDGVLGWMHKNFNTEQHTFGAWVTDGTRSCEQGVTMARSCGNDGCDLVQTVELPAYGHIWDSGTLLAAPDGVRCGIVEHTCSRCNGTGYEVLDPEIWAYEQFGDVDPTLWSYEGIQFCVMMGYMSGMDTHVFAPRGVTTRAQLVQILYNFVGGPAVSGETPFTDLTANWYKDAVLWAYQTGVTSGTSETTPSRASRSRCCCTSLPTRCWSSAERRLRRTCPDSRTEIRSPPGRARRWPMPSRSASSTAPRSAIRSSLRRRAVRPATRSPRCSRASAQASRKLNPIQTGVPIWERRFFPSARLPAANLHRKCEFQEAN